jgi:hypothetical protein
MELSGVILEHKFDGMGRERFESGFLDCLDAVVSS